MNFLLKHMILFTFLGLLTCLGIFVLYNTYQRATSKHSILPTSLIDDIESKKYERIVLAGGCFWCTESEYDHVEGVVSAVSGYADVETSYPEGSGPTYAQVSSQEVKARESVQVVYDSSKISTEKILEIYVKHIDPTDEGGQFADRGYQYSPAIYYTTEAQKHLASELFQKIDATKKFDHPVAVSVTPFTNFYPAEEYHQKYKEKNPVRYALYREGSGRNTFIRANWEDTSTFMKDIFGNQHSTTTQKAASPSGAHGQSNDWQHFTQEEKALRLTMLTPLSFNVTQKGGTEKPFENEYQANHEKGIYVDIVSGEPLFLSVDKYDSGTGWPSFVKPVREESLTLHVDNGIFSTRTEVRSRIADSHLGHVFLDGPANRGGKRYCMNSAALRFVPLAQMEQEGYGAYTSQLQAGDQSQNK